MHLLMKGLADVSTEIRLHCLACNMRRVMISPRIPDMINMI